MGIAGKALFHARQADQHEADLIAIEEIAQLLQAGHAQPVCLIDKDEADGTGRVSTAVGADRIQSMTCNSSKRR